MIGLRRRWSRNSRRLYGVALVSLFSLSLAWLSFGVADQGSVVRLRLIGPISPAAGDYLSSGLERAYELGAAALLLELDTPGGLLNSTQTMVKDVLAAKVPVLIWVSPAGGSATSAGVFLTMAGHIAAMAPGTTIGAAHPVSGQGEDIQGDMRDKVENYAASFVASIAAQRGRNVEWAEKAVRESVSITEAEAVELNVVDFVAVDVTELLRKASGKEVSLDGETVLLDFGSLLEPGGLRVVDLEKTLRQQVLEVVADPNIAYLLMMGAMLGLYMEFSNPGVIFPGVAGAICLLLALMAGQVLPISSVGILLAVLGMLFLIAELVTPSFGVLGAGGLLALTLGSLFLYTPDSGLTVDRGLIASTVGLFATLIAGILYLVVRDRQRRPRSGIESLVGDVGRSLTEIQNDGSVKVHGEIWAARSEHAVPAGAAVKVVAVEPGMRLLVEQESPVQEGDKQ